MKPRGGARVASRAPAASQTRRLEHAPTTRLIGAEKPVPPRFRAITAERSRCRSLTRSRERTGLRAPHRRTEALIRRCTRAACTVDAMGSMSASALTDRTSARAAAGRGRRDPTQPCLARRMGDPTSHTSRAPPRARGNATPRLPVTMCVVQVETLRTLLVKDADPYAGGPFASHTPPPANAPGPRPAINVRARSPTDPHRARARTIQLAHTARGSPFASIAGAWTSRRAARLFRPAHQTRAPRSRRLHLGRPSCACGHEARRAAMPVHDTQVRARAQPCHAA
jgi:hypothetical protein